MAKVLGVSTTTKGKVGNQVFATWKGVQILKTRVIPHNPKSAAQMTNRDAFASLVDFGKSINTNLIKPIWDRLSAVHSTGWSDFIGYNQRNFAGVGFNLEELTVSKGSLAKVVVSEVTYNDGTGEVIATWADNSDEINAAADDNVAALIYDESSNAFFFGDLATRTDGTGTITLPDGLTLADLSAYIFCYVGTLPGGPVTASSLSSYVAPIASGV